MALEASPTSGHHPGVRLPPILLRCSGGTVALPDATRVLVDRLDGGHLIVHPPRPVWERSELTHQELCAWSALVASTGRAMLDVLPQLERGCINYWEAGNWSLHDAAAPKGPKAVRRRRRVHQHLLGRSRTATHPSWLWGEAPLFPRFAQRQAWSATLEQLTRGECRDVIRLVVELLERVHGITSLPARGL